MSENTRGKKKKGGVFWKIVLVVSIIVFAVSAGVLIHHWWIGHEDEKNFEELRVNGGHDLTELHKQNSDIVGWLKIPNTKVDYPVMQTPNENEYYLRRNFRKEHSVAGTPFMDAGSVIGTSKNYLIFGHNMKNGTMFHDILKYEDREFWEKNRTFTFDTLDGNHKYRVVAAFRSQIYSKSSKKFKYYSYASITDKQTYDEYVSNAKQLCSYDTGVTPTYGQQLITLSTCAYHVKNGRFAVVAVQTD
ncbi:MAG: class B sortase [Anaerovoracaceae bacterium]|nr:class B sortase [Anaerovoracaceae bacterium]